MKTHLIAAGALAVAVCTALPAAAQGHRTMERPNGPYRIGPLSEAHGRPVPAADLSRSGPPPSDPLMVRAERNRPPGEFLLSDSQQSEIATFRRPRRVSVCIAHSRHPTADTAMPRTGRNSPRLVPLDVSWRHYHARLMPGHCLFLKARQLRLQPAGSLANGDSLVGRVAFE